MKVVLNNYLLDPSVVRARLKEDEKAWPPPIKTPSGKKYQLHALTMTDPATGWFEVKDVRSQTAENCMLAFGDNWLSCYPRPQYIGYDNGSEYKQVFKDMCDNYGLKEKPSTAYNPQSNGIIERVHQVLNDALCTFELESRELNEDDPWTEFLSAAAFAIRSTYHTTLEATLAQLVFNRDMILPVQFRTDWTRLKNNGQTVMNRNNTRENRSRIQHDYQVSDKILLRIPGILRKLSTPRTGPFEITRVYTNGTIHIQRGSVTERINIRHVDPFFEPDS